MGFFVLIGVALFYFLPLGFDLKGKCGDFDVIKIIKTIFIHFFPFVVFLFFLTWLVFCFYNYNSIDLTVVSGIFVLFVVVLIRGFVFDLSLSFTVFCFFSLSMALIVSYAGYAEGKSVLDHAKAQGICNVKMDGGEIKQGWLVKSNSSLLFFVDRDNDLFMVSTGKLISYTCKKRRALSPAR